MAGKLASVVNNKKEGFLYEMNFFNKALQKGLDVFLPAGDYLPVDCIVQNSKGATFKVQIKGTRKTCEEKALRKIPRYRLSTGKGKNGKEPIDCSSCDILVGYVAPLEVFYIIPCPEILGVTTWLYPGNPNTRSRLEKYRENWDVFENYDITAN